MGGGGGGGVSELTVLTFRMTGSTDDDFLCAGKSNLLC